MRPSSEKVLQEGRKNENDGCNRRGLLPQTFQRIFHDHGYVHVAAEMGFVKKKKITWHITSLFIIFLFFSARVSGNPLPKQGQAVKGNNNNVSPSFYPPNRFVSSSIHSQNSNNNETSEKAPLTSLTLEKDNVPEQVLVEPSKMTFELKHPFCKEDVSLTKITCRNVRRREDLPTPESQNTFKEVQQAIFINITGNDIRLEHIKTLFPNLIVLGIVESPGVAASLINLQATSSQTQWGRREDMVPKSLLQDKFFAMRLKHLRPTLTSFGGGSSSGGVRGQRALNTDYSTTTTSTTTTTTTTPSTTTTSPSSTTPLGNGFEDSHETNDIPLSDMSKDLKGEESNGSGDTQNNHDLGIQMDTASEMKDMAVASEKPEKRRKLVWPSIRQLNLSWNDLTSDALPNIWGEMFPNLELLDLSNNLVVGLEKVEKAGWPRLENIDVSGNPLDCVKLNLDWIDSGKIQLLHPNETMCDQPPHQNKPKPIFKVLPLIKNMRDKCKALKNCTCDIDYIYEKDHVVHSMTVVNCSGQGFLDFPDPALLPQPTSTLDLRRNKIHSLATFVDNLEYLNLNVTNLYLDDNQISSINILEGSEWFYDFQVFSIQRNNLTEVPVYVLENIFRQNERLLQLDLSGNKFRCDCSTVSSFKIWLLKYASQIGNVENVRCASTDEQIRHMRMEVWCKMDDGAELINVLDMVSIVLATLIIVVIAKVYYDYWNFRKKGKLPWIVSKM